jgi:hypothetical protein
MILAEHPVPKDIDRMRRFLYIGRLFREIFQFAMQNKAWWIVPTVLILLVLGVLIFSGQAVAPFIYTLF